MKIKKVLNNNAVIVQEGNIEKIVMGSGIAFQKRKNDIILKSKIEKVFIIEDANELRKFQEILSTVPLKHIKIAEEIISYAEAILLSPLNDHIYVALTDHLAFAFERLKQGYTIQNKLLQEIKVLYSKEFEIGLWAKKRIKEILKIDIPDDEVGYIALHIHTAKTNQKSVKATLDVTTFVQDIVEIIENELDLNIKEQTVAYQFLVTHLRFAFQRLRENVPFQEIDEEMLHVIKKNHAKAFETGNKIAQFVKKEYQYVLPVSEQAYLSLHIQRLAQK